MRFAQRAKMIQNKAVVNQDMQGNVPQLHAEIHKLKQEIAMLTAGHQSSAIATPTTTPPDDKELGTTQYLLILALRKLRESERQKSRYAEIAFELKESLDRQKLQLQQQSLILKLRTAENSSLRLATGYQSDAENRSLREEITALQSTLSAMPDASDLLVENLQLREQIELFQLSRSSKPDTLTIPDVDATAEALESLLRTNTPLTDLQSLLPVIPDHAEYDRLEESVRQLQHDVGEMEIQKNAAEFQLTSVEEDWQAVHDGCVELKGAATVQERERIIAHTLDNIVNEQPRATWMAMAEMYTNQQAHLFY
ncbi:hypothetical protein FBU59_006074 [Linderina macrospora]|uniref:Uncharacterized protein n=1 Tax=Linderina macrospora TaxID=4868 RepID=A0ACC1J110_9FUNG|nr:hypothetical protein FBU59_006074 [Linderina macrospora]